MTSIPVSNATKNAQTIANQKSAYEPLAAAKAEQSGISFQDAMDMFGSQEPVKNDEKKLTDANDAFARTQNSQSKVESSVKTEQEISENKLSEEELEKVELSEKNIVSEISEKLGVSEEEVEAAMEQLGLSAFDLLNPNNMALLMMDLLNISDQTMLLTNSELFDTLTDLTQTVEAMLNSVAEELGISTEELQMQLETVQMQDVLESGDMTVTDEDASGVSIPGQNVEASNLQVVTTVETEMQDEIGENQSKTTEEISEPAESNETGQKTDVAENVSTESADSELARENMQDDRGAQSGETMNQNTFTTFSNNIEQAVMARNTEAAPTFSFNTMESILNQIGEYVEINVTPDVTSMEIHLTPANLGNVHINIASKNGLITAQITAENEVVKQALETQVVQLKERLESQGVKIEAVEVTVESHEFERNLDENSENREQNEEAVRKTARKKWNLSDMEEELVEEQLTEAEKVELDMMKLKGNRLNYMI